MSITSKGINLIVIKNNGLILFQITMFPCSFIFLFICLFVYHVSLLSVSFFLFFFNVRFYMFFFMSSLDDIDTALLIIIPVKGKGMLFSPSIHCVLFCAKYS